MVHKKSTYKLTYRNYAPHVRQSVWQENNDIRQRRIEEERSHHSIEESDSDCVCDECEEEEHTQALPPRGLGVARLLAPRHTLTQAQEQGREQAGVPSQVAGPPPAVPRLRFSPDHSPPRICNQPRTPDSTDEEGSGEDRDALPPQTHGGGSARDLHETHIPAHPREVSVGSRNRARSSSIQRGVMRQGGHAREYDLIPGIVHVSVMIF
ncbi:hypothetical protein GWK47_043604 [Chionoecetes opilio]|uniref:Uncharacterized protein n=1 Tax=Chionoecetes opilio TaxID=41210 RepID=A0A8J4YA65_CHIOP|nr:hypothetical protein GWK47_043604 [Chionoecetes opilio]